MTEPMTAEHVGATPLQQLIARWADPLGLSAVGIALHPDGPDSPTGHSEVAFINIKSPVLAELALASLLIALQKSFQDDAKRCPCPDCAGRLERVTAMAEVYTVGMGVFAEQVVMQ